jgi:hypothetical protein
MMYDEFLQLARVTSDTVSHRQYETEIEPVYLYHPALDNLADPKSRLVELYKLGVLPDMLPRALALQKADAALAEFTQAVAVELERHAERVNLEAARHQEQLSWLRGEQLKWRGRIQSLQHGGELGAQAEQEDGNDEHRDGD